MFKLQRRSFVKAALSSILLLPIRRLNALASETFKRITIFKTDPKIITGSNLGEGWEGLNLGYWKIENGAMRRVLSAVGDRARNTGFPYHYESQLNPDGKMPREYDPSLPMGTMWNRHWKLANDYSIKVTAKICHLSAARQRQGEGSSWAMYQTNYGLFGISFGGHSQFESFYPSPEASPMFIVKEDGSYGLMRYQQWEPVPVTLLSQGKVAPLQVDDLIELDLRVSGNTITAILTVNSIQHPTLSITDAEFSLSGYFGLVARGLLDVEVSEVDVQQSDNITLNAPLNDCHVCYPLGDTLKKVGGCWQVRFIGIFRSAGELVQIKVADSAKPVGGWQGVLVAGQAAIVSNDFRVNTAVIDVLLPHSPADKTLYYTLWKDGVDVTTDPRIGTDSVGPGTGLVGDVPNDGNYVGRLPQLTAPYRVCGLSCHAIHTAGKSELDDDGQGGWCGPRVTNAPVGDCRIPEPFFVHDQPCHGAFKYLEDFNYQIMLWEDDVWYMELLLYPPSTVDAYKIVTTSIAGPTTRWQMMQHWNVLNPGDHDHGMDDVKGPEQLVIRNRADLGQDPSYMVRNFQIVSHLMTGKENPSGKDNPKRWRKWKMPNRDFSLMVMDSRLWRTSQDTAIWADEGWGHDKELYSRSDPTRTLLGEEQFAWLLSELRTDSSMLICLTGINVLHTIWGGHSGTDWLNMLVERDRVSADYAGWVKAGADRVLELISERGGVVTIYGDVHAGSIVRNEQLRIFECSFGPIGRWGGRSLIEGFARKMQDFDGRAIEVIALYHHEFNDPDLGKQGSINYWNVLEAEFDTRPTDPLVSLAIRNITDTLDAPKRGGGAVTAAASDMGKPLQSKLAPFNTLKSADILFLNSKGQPIRGARSDANGLVSIKGFSSLLAGEKIVMLAISGDKTDSQLLPLLVM
jgi:hypothetical protein